LDQDIRQQLFRTDVVIYDTYFDDINQNYTKTDTFHALNRVVEAGLRLFNFENYQQTVEYILRNTLNSVLIKNEEISQSILASLNSQRKTMKSNITAATIILSMMFGGFLVGITVIFWQQYLKQTRNLSAFCRMNRHRLNDILQGFHQFKQDVEDEHVEYYQNNLYFHRFHSQKVDQSRNYNKTTNTWDLQKKYFFLMLKVAVFVTFFIAIIIITSVINHNSINSSRTLQEQVYFLDHSNARIALIETSIRELLSTNNVAFIEEKPALDELKDSVGDLNKVRQQIYYTLLDNTKQENQHTEYLQSIIYGDKCPIFDDDLYFIFEMICSSAVDEGTKLGLIYILSSYSNLARAVIDSYESSDKTEDALQTMIDKYNADLVVLSHIARKQFDQATAWVDQRFEENLDKTHQQRKAILISYFVVAIVSYLLFFKIVLVKCRDSINKFKNVLAVLPGDIILGSFILKTFLLKTSHGTLDAIKHQI